MPKKKIVKKKHNKGNTKNVIAPKRYETKVGNTVCKKHGKRWLLDPQHSTLCCAPDCLISLVEVHSHKSESIKKLLSVINKHHNREDLTSYMVERFLIEMEDGKPAILNRTWLWFTLQRFIRDEMIQQEIEDELLEAQRITEDNTSSWTKRYTSETPEKILIGKDLLAFVAEEWGNDLALFYSGSISKSDLMKIRGCSFRNIRDKMREVEEFMRELYDNNK